MQKIISMFLWISGAGPKLWTAVDGSKTYLLAAASILTGVLGLLQEAIPILMAHDAGALYAFMTALPHDQSWLMILGAGGLGALRHAMAKQATAAPAVDPAAK